MVAPVSAAVKCPGCNTSTFVSSPYCAGRTAYDEYVSCSMVGTSKGGYYHYTGCRIYRLYYYTGYNCSGGSIWCGGFVNGSHLENFHHTTGGPSNNPSCRY